MSIEKKRQRRPMRVVVAGGAGFALVLLLTAGTKGWADLDSVRKREELLLSRVDRTQTAIERLERRLILLADDEQRPPPW